MQEHSVKVITIQPVVIHGSAYISDVSGRKKTILQFQFDENFTRFPSKLKPSDAVIMVMCVLGTGKVCTHNNVNAHSIHEK